MSGQDYLVATKQGPLNCVVDVPGSKSIANRALVCASLAHGISTIRGLPDGDDTTAMLGALKVLGANITSIAGGVRFDSAIDLDDSEARVVDAKLAGTTARFLTALGALRSAPLTVDGGASLQLRPMEDLHRALADIGAVVVWADVDYHLPVTVRRGESSHHSVRLAADTSSQFVTALMLIAPLLEKGLHIELMGDVVSQPYIAMSASVMRSFGARVDFDDERTIVVHPGGYLGCDYEIEPDASSASYPYAAVAIVGGQLRVSGISPQMMQGDARFLDVLRQMGCRQMVDDTGVTLTRNADVKLIGIDIDMSEMSDVVPTLAAVALFASSATRIRGVGFIRKKESDRIGDLAHELRKLGAQVVEHDDGLEILPRPLHAGRCDTHYDHRLAMAFGLIGLVVSGVVIDQPAVVSKSWPTYWEMLERI
ncbi:MAG: 3-phosphoshikimate 1-carboxyvinyltransferase [Actinobacteria bacterium]|nr:MAG: 3-phosphoshikimate 1-carboxyvinyltransferase [Actinomycetota bacterium]